MIMWITLLLFPILFRRRFSKTKWNSKLHVFRKGCATQHIFFASRTNSFSISVRHKIIIWPLRVYLPLFTIYRQEGPTYFIFPVYCLFCHSQQIIQIRSILWENGPINNIESPSFSSTFDTEIAHKSALLSENQEMAEMGHL